MCRMMLCFSSFENLGWMFLVPVHISIYLGRKQPIGWKEKRSGRGYMTGLWVALRVQCTISEEINFASAKTMLVGVLREVVTEWRGNKHGKFF